MGTWKRLGRGPAMDPEDRRSVCRYPVVQTRGWLGWWEGPTFRSADARLVDISLRGCMMTVDRLPPGGRTVWFCPPGTDPSEWIEAKLVEAQWRLLGPRVVRVAFLQPFPYETFKNLVYGPEALTGTDPVPEVHGPGFNRL